MLFREFDTIVARAQVTEQAESQGTREVMTMTPVTYRRDYATPRFVPFSQHEQHGAWIGGQHSISMEGLSRRSNMRRGRLDR